MGESEASESLKQKGETIKKKVLLISLTKVVIALSEDKLASPMNSYTYTRK